MVFCIKKFSLALCLVYSTDRSLDDITFQCFEMTNNRKDVLEVIYKLSKIFKEDIHSIMDNAFTTQVKPSFNFFMKASLSRYVKMSADPSYFYFMLLCSLIHTFVFDTFTDLRCFTFAQVSSLCLIAVYNRCYRDLFEKGEETESLGSYCKRINSSLNSEDGSIDLPVDHEELRSLLASLKDVDCRNFSLTDLEENLLDDNLNMVSGASPNLSPPSESSSDDKSDSKENIGAFNVEQQLPAENRICDVCDRKCFEFLILYERKVIEKGKKTLLIKE